MRNHRIALLVVFWGLAFSPKGSDAGELRDPTRPPTRRASPTRAAPAAPRIALEAVWITPQRRVARISGREVEEGDLVLGARVERIEPAAVALERAGESLVLTFTQTVIRPAEGQP